MSWPRVILHVDMDAFFASVVQLDQPELRGKPVLVGGSGKRGVVAAASYEARVFGCRSAQPTAVALRLCPQAIIARPGPGRIREQSERAFAVFERVTPLVQPLSIDEAFLDVTGSVRLLGEPRAIAERIRREVFESTGGLTCSVGVAPNKFLAKIASDMDKPDGLVVIEPERAHDVLDPMPVTAIHGIGPAGEASLARLGVRTIGALRALPPGVVRDRLGTFGERVHRLAQGLDDRPVRPDREAKSIGHERTFGEDLSDPDEVRGVLCAQAEDVARRLRKHGRLARTVTIKVRYGNFETITRQRAIDAEHERPTDGTDAIWAAARALFETWARQFRPVRLIGVSVSGLSEAGSTETQMGLFAPPEATDERQRALDRAADAIAEKFGKNAVRRARSMRDADDRSWF